MLATAALALAPAPATAAIDLLKVPALQSPIAAKGTLLAVANAGKAIVAAGERGIIVYSHDQGVTWRQARVPVSVTLTSLYFVSDQLGWAAGHDGVILRTVDGARTWHKQFDGNVANALMLDDLRRRRAAAQAAGAAQAELADTLDNAVADLEGSAAFGPSLPLLGIWFADADRGLAVGAFGQLFHTADGGRNWATWGARIDNPEGFHYNSINRIGDGSLVIAGEAGKLRRSRDGGASWETLDTGYAGHLYGVLAPAGSKAIVAFGFGGTVLRSEDDGKSWKALPRLVNKALVGGMVAPDGSLALAAGDGQVLVSRDGGASFTLVKAGAGRPLAALLPQPLGDKRLLAAGSGGTRILVLDQPPHASP
ncbi:conserved exported hypothetical protein [Massilia sp. 9I]|nr:conserved exported hypothetical protein [Massilia sp. 9I]